MNAWVIGGYPYHAERERLAQRLGAECVLIQSTRAECLARAAERPPEWIDYVNVWFDRVEGLNRDIMTETE